MTATCPLARCRGNGRAHGVAKLGTVGQLGQRVPVGQLPYLGLLLGHVDAHVVKSARQVTDLVAALGVLHGLVVLTAAQAVAGPNE